MLFLRFVFASVILTWCSFTAAAQVLISSFDHYDVDDGLTQNSVWQTLQDTQGFMWFVTSGGLCRFDGETFLSYKSAVDDTNTLFSNHINSIAQGAGNDIWIGGAGGISRMVARTNKVERFFSIRDSPGKNYYLLGQEAELLWFWVESRGVFAVNIRTRQIAASIPMQCFQTHTNDHCLKIIAVNKDYFFAVLSETGLVRVNRHTLKREQVAAMSIPQQDQPVFLAHQKQRLFFRETQLAGSLSIYDMQSGELMRIGIGNLTVTDACADGEDLLLATRENCIIRIKSANKYLSGDTVGNIERTTLKGTFTHLYVDRSGVVWGGTDGTGIYKSIPCYRKFRHYSAPVDSQKLVKSIFTCDGLVYVCSFDGYIDVFRTSGTYVKQVRGEGKTSFRTVVANARESTTSYWVAGVDCFGIYNVAKGEFTNYMPHLRGIADSMTIEPHFCALHKLDVETLWVGFGTLLFQLSRGSGEGYTARCIKSFGTDKITSIASRGDVVAVGTAKRVHIYDRGAGTWQQPATMPTDLVKCLLFQSDSILWIGTENGLCKYNPGSRTIRHYDERAGLPNTFIYGLVRYGNKMWISTNKGLSRYDYESGRFQNYSTKDGLQSNEFNTGAYHISQAGQLYFGGPKGVNGFHDSDIRDNPFSPQVQFTGIKLFDDPLLSDTSCSQLSVLTMPFYQNTLSFEFIAMEYSNPECNEYAYMMSGIDKGWIYSGRRHFARYANLPPGTYRFLVKAGNNNGSWQPVPKSITIIIGAPYWKRGWFIALSIAAGAAIIALLVFYMQRRQYRKKLAEMALEQKIQRERERISRDLHDNVGSQISYLVSNIDWINHHKIAEQERQERLGSLSVTAQSMMGNMRETIWALSKNAISLEELSDKLKAFVQQQLRYNDKMKFQAEEHITGGYHFPPGMALNIFRICQEAVTNAIKHSGGSLLTVKVESVSSAGFSIQIIDTGKGFELQSVTGNDHYGLSNMQLRAAECGATFRLISNPGQGTTIVISK